MKIKMRRTPTKISLFFRIRCGYSSHSPVIMASNPPNVLSIPRVINMMKNNIDQIVDPDMAARASGYTTNTSPGPSAATVAMSFFNTAAMYPKTEKMTNPATKLVRQLTVLVKIASLYMLCMCLHVSNDNEEQQGKREHSLSVRCHQKSVKHDHLSKS